MTNICFSYERGTVPQISVQLETANGRKRMLGEIDSGSVRSLCPKIFADELGITLKKDVKKGAPALGGEFDLWVPDGMGISGQIVMPDADTGEMVPWGPLFAMEPAFAETETLLLGQRDFFAAFDIKLLSRNGDGMVEICECPPGLKGP